MTIDERLEFLAQSTESLHASTQELHAIVQAHAEQLALNEKRWERVRRIVKAALKAAIDDEDEGSPK